MSGKNALAILGSPHTNGTTAAMLDLAIGKAEQIGYAVTKINLYEKELSFCTGCRTCVLTDCWERLWKKRIHFPNHDCGASGICF